MRRIGYKLILFSVALLVINAACFADDWSIGTGGNSPRYGYNSAYGPEDTTVLWQGGATSVIAWQPVIDGDIVAVARCADLGDTLHGTKIVAYDLSTGTELWTEDLPIDFPSTDWRNHVSAIKDGKVYASRAGNTNASYMYALDATDGSQIWKSEDIVDECSSEGVAFAPDGDLLVGNFESVMRIDCDDGTTVWETPRSSPTSNGSEVAVFNGKAYGWKSTGYGPAIAVFDIDDGQYLYESDGIEGGFIQQVAPFVGPDGTVYAPRSCNNPSTDYLVAFDDNGSSLVEKWRVEIGYIPFASFGVGPDGSVYTYDRNGAIVRLDPDTGSVVDTSQNISAGIGVRMAIDGNGRVFAADNDYLYSFNADLSLRWSEYIYGVVGPAMAYDGTLIACGRGTNLIAYEGSGPSGIDDGDDPGTPLAYGAYLLPNYPNPFDSRTTIGYVLPSDCTVNLSIYNMKGQLIRELVDRYEEAGDHTVNWNAGGLSAGVYLTSLNVDGENVDVRRVVVR